MSEAVAEAGSNEEVDTSAESEDATEIDWKAQARKHEARAKENAAKAKANESAAQRLRELEEANKTADQKAQERLTAAETRAQELEAKANLAEAAASLSIPVAVLAGPVDRTPEGLAEYAETLTNWRGEQKAAPSSAALGRVNGQRVTGTTADQFADFMQSQLNN